MAAAIISAEDFVRTRFAEAIEEHNHIGPTAKAILGTLLTETASHVGAEEVRGAKCIDGNRFTVKLALGVLNERYSHEVVMLILSLNNE